MTDHPGGPVAGDAVRHSETLWLRLNRSLQALRHSAQALMRASDEAAYLREICRIVVEDCGHRLVWVGFAEDDEVRSVRPVAYSGFEQGYLETLHITWADTDRGRGPTGSAIRTGHPSICRNMLTDPAFLPWREQALARGYASSIALPLKADGVTFGALMIYCAEPDPFSDDEVRLLTDLADDLAHGIHVLRLQAAHARAEEGMRVAHEALAEADRRKDEFLAILSHELRNPLAAIRYAVPLLQQERLSATGARGLGVVDRQLDHLTRLVDDLLDISRITSGKIELRREQVTLDAIVKAATEASSPAIAAARHALKILLPDEPIWLHGDSARLAQILTNILSNATRYTPCGGEITLEARRDEGQAVIRVRDNGIGIPPEALTTIFDMFRQVDRPDSSQGGLGIGLALVRQLVEMHGGSIEAQSAGIGQGATFEIRLPISREGRAAGPDRTRLTPALSPRLRVLVVDDNTDLADMLAIVVENAGHEVRKALDGATAVAAALSFRPHVVLLDLGLPIMSGIEVAKELRRHPEMSGVRLVALTGWGQADDRSQTREAGFDDHLTKPTDPVELERLLADAGNALANP